MYSGTINNQIIKQALVETLGATLDRNGLPSAKKSVWYEKSKLYIADKKMFSYNQYTPSLVKYKTDDNARDVELT